jgi:hypothetical protein
VKQFLTGIFILVLTLKIAGGFLKISPELKRDYLSFYCKVKLQQIRINH